MDLLAAWNDAQNELAVIIAERDTKGNYFIAPAVDNLVANQREYAWPDDILNHIFTVECDFVGNSPLTYALLLPDDFRRWGNRGRTEANITSLYSNSFPRFEIQRRSIYILSGTIIAVVNGIRVRYRVYPAAQTDMTLAANDMMLDPTTISFGFPKQFHELCCRRVSMEWKSNRPKPIPLSITEQKYEQDLEKTLVAIIDPDLSGEVIASIPQDDGSQL